MPVCNSCGADVDVGDRFCGACGALTTAPAGSSKGRSGQAKKDAGKKNPAELRSTVRGMPPVPPTVPPAAPGASSSGKNQSSLLQRLDRSPPMPAAPERTKAETAKGPGAPQLQRPPVSASTFPAAASPSGAGRPSASPPAASPPAVPPSGRSEFQRLLDEVESGFEEILTNKSEPPPNVALANTDISATGAPAAPADAALSNVDPLETQPTSENEFDESQARELFADLVVANAHPIRDFMIELRHGEPHRAWVDSCEASVRAILRSAEAMGMADLVERLRDFLATLEGAKPGAAIAASDPVVHGEIRDRMIDAYAELAALFPEAFAFEKEANQREVVIVAALLSKVPGLQKLGLDRIYEARLSSLEMFLSTSPREIAELAMVPLEIAERIVERFRDHRRMTSELSPVKGRLRERELLRRATDELERANRAYDNAASSSPERRVHRRERALAMADIAIFFARFGEVERLRKLETLSFDTRVEMLRAFIEELERRAHAEQRAR